MYVFFWYLAQMIFGWNLTVENTTFSSILIRWTNLTNVLNRKVGHYVVFLNRRNNTVTLHQVVNGDQLTTEINGLTYSTNYSVEVVGVDTMGKPYKTPSEATMTANRKRETPLFFCFCFVFVFFFSVNRSVQLPGNFPYPEKVWKIELKSWKKSWVFLKATTSASQVNFFRVVQIFFNLACTLWKKLCSFVPALSFFFFPQVSIDHLFDNLELGKKNILFWRKKTAKSLKFWIKNLHKLTQCVNTKKNFEVSYF